MVEASNPYILGSTLEPIYIRTASWTSAKLFGWDEKYLYAGLARGLGTQLSANFCLRYIGLWEKIGREDLLIRVTGGAVALITPETNWK